MLRIRLGLPGEIVDGSQLLPARFGARKSRFEGWLVQLKGRLIITGSGDPLVLSCSFIPSRMPRTAIYLPRGRSLAHEVCMQDRARRRVCIVVLPPPLWVTSCRTIHSVQAKVMSAGAQPSSISDLATFTIRLDGLRENQNPDDLSNPLCGMHSRNASYTTCTFLP